MQLFPRFISPHFQIFRQKKYPTILADDRCYDFYLFHSLLSLADDRCYDFYLFHSLLSLFLSKEQKWFGELAFLRHFLLHASNCCLEKESNKVLVGAF